MGRPNLNTVEHRRQLRQVVKLYRRKTSLTEIAKQIGRSRTNVNALLRKARRLGILQEGERRYNLGWKRLFRPLRPIGKMEPSVDDLRSVATAADVFLHRRGLA